MGLSDIKKLWSGTKQRTQPEYANNEERVEKDDENVEKGDTTLPLLQVWPSQDSPGRNQSQLHFSFDVEETGTQNQHDSGIDSVQASPASQFLPSTSDSVSPNASNRRRASSASYLHPNHARLLRSQSPSVIAETSFDQLSSPGSRSSSTASSMTSINGNIDLRYSDPYERRRSSAVTRNSLFDAWDWECSLLRAATRGSFGQSSFSHSFQKLTFTQSLAFPALARGMANNGRPSRVRSSITSAKDSACISCAKIITVLILLTISVSIFTVVVKLSDL